MFAFGITVLLAPAVGNVPAILGFTLFLLVVVYALTQASDHGGNDVHD